MVYFATLPTYTKWRTLDRRRAVPFALLAFVAFFPTYIFGDLFAGQRVLYLLYPLICTAVFICVSFEKPRIFLHQLAKLLLAFSVVLLSTIVFKVGMISEHVLVTHLRFFAYTAVFIFVYSATRRLSICPEHIVSASSWIVTLVLCFIALQFADLFPSFLQAISARTPYTWQGIQIGGPIVWSYGLGFLLLPVLYFFLTKLVLERFSLKIAIFIVLISTILIFTQSKAVYLAITLTLATFLIMMFFRRKIRGKEIVIAGVFALLSFISVFLVSTNLEHFGNILRFLSAIQEGELDASTQSRAYQLSFAFGVLVINPLFGAPEERVIIENAYGFYLYNFGLTGLFVYVGVIFALLLAHWRIVQYMKIHSFSTDARALSIGMFMYVLGSVAISLANSPLDGHKSSYLFWTLNALYFASFANERMRGASVPHPT